MSDVICYQVEDRKIKTYNDFLSVDIRKYSHARCMYSSTIPNLFSYLFLFLGGPKIFQSLGFKKRLECLLSALVLRVDAL